MAYCVIMNKNKLDLNIAVEALKDYFTTTGTHQNKIKEVMSKVAQKYNISVEDLKSKKKTNNIAYPRQIAMYLAREHLNESLTKIGLEFGGKNHTTVMHSVEKIKNMINNDEMLREFIEKMKKEL